MRVQVNISDEMVKRIDKYASMMGVSRSALCSMAVGNYILGLDKSLDVINSLGDKLGDALLAEKALKEINNV